MNDLTGYIVAAVMAGLTTIYLVLAMLLPERF